ncbi:unnamed protein product [Leptidea sinapis]|uniref:NTF2 domain-containing protein n=1 Tax=Leptidea sinapis TaxID=189913 RepID=A0A5E4QGY6_9NEOP|nr:unnamed protein product [Leptidea sinapis]
MSQSYLQRSNSTNNQYFDDFENDKNFIHFEEPEETSTNEPMLDVQCSKAVESSSTDVEPATIILRGSRPEAKIPIILRRNISKTTQGGTHNIESSETTKAPAVTMPKVSPAPIENIWSNNIELVNETKKKGKKPNTSGGYNQNSNVQSFTTPGVAQLRKVTGIPKSFLAKNFEAKKISEEYNKWTHAGKLDHQPTIKDYHQTFAQSPNMVSQTSDLTLQIPSNSLHQIYSDISDKPSVEQYSPTDVYNEETGGIQGLELEDNSSQESGQKRLSAFQRLGPVMCQPKKPKLTINLSVDKEQSVREVVDVTEQYLSVHEREYIIKSEDPIVMRYRDSWPWKTNPIPIKRRAYRRHSKTVMMLEKEQFDEEYKQDNVFIDVLVTGYPPSWTKENVLDAVLENCKDISFIPCFIKFTPKECEFLVNRSRLALLNLHAMGLILPAGDVDLIVSVAVTYTKTTHLDFIPRTVLRTKLNSCYDAENHKLDLSEFTLKPDISHFIYFPMHRTANQADLFSVPQINWENLKELDLSHNRISKIEGFDLARTTPNLKRLNLSHNKIERVISLISCKGIMLRSLSLEGNPLCWNYVDGDHYIKVVRTLFPSLRELDGIPITLKGDMPTVKQNYCPEGAQPVVEKFIDVFIPLLNLPRGERRSIQTLYHADAMLTVTCRSKLRFGRDAKALRSLFCMSRELNEKDRTYVHGVEKIVRQFKRWPDFVHDVTSMLVDVMYHDDSTTVIRMSGVLTVTSSSLADDEHLLAYSRTVVLKVYGGLEYKIHNEMLYWDEPTAECVAQAFHKTLPTKTLSIKFEGTPDDEIKKHLIKIFTKLTSLGSKTSERCLTEKDWNIKDALEYVVKLVKLDNIDLLNKE